MGRTNKKRYDEEKAVYMVCLTPIRENRNVLRTVADSVSQACKNAQERMPKGRF
jgi:hypothetical protein